MRKRGQGGDEMDAGWTRCGRALNLVQAHSNTGSWSQSKSYRHGADVARPTAADDEETPIKDRTRAHAHTHTHKQKYRETERKGLLLDHMVILEEEAKV